MQKLFSLCLIFVQVLGYHKVINELENYVSINATFAKLLNQTFSEAAQATNPSIITYVDMYCWLDAYITIIGNHSNTTFENTVNIFAGTPTGQILFVEKKSQAWIMKYFMAKKDFADSFNSTAIIPVWEDWYKINMSEYIIPANGFQSFNEFFTRQIYPDLRPISSPNNDSIIVSPCDGNIDWIEYDLAANTQFNIKHERYNLSQMLNNNQHFVDKFIGGTAIEILLETYNYHRYHSSVSGYIDEMDIINGYILVLSQWLNESIPCFYANNNVRGVTYVYNRNIGWVAQVYVGMQLYNSINFDVSPGVFVNKGDEIGYFKYGGSAIVLLFEKNAIDDVVVKFSDVIQMGQSIAISNVKSHTNKYEL